MIKVSIIVPVYNQGKYLNQCMDSILGQSLKEIEIICINDGSTDNSLPILKQYADADKRIKVINQENRGVSAARNRGIRISSGEFLMFMDPDDYYPSEDIIEALYLTAKRENVRICGGSFSECHEDGSVRTKWDGIYNDYTFENDHLVSFAEYQFDYGFHRFLYDAELIRPNQTAFEDAIMFPDYITFEDPPFLVRAMLRAGYFYAMRKITYCYRWRYKQILWDKRRVNDLVRGISDNMCMACENKMSKLLYLNYRRITVEYLERIKNCMKADNTELIGMLIHMNNRIDARLLTQALPVCDQQIEQLPLYPLFIKDGFDQKKAQQLEDEIQKIYHSTTYRTGKLLLYLPQKLRELRKHGFSNAFQKGV